MSNTPDYIYYPSGRRVDACVCERTEDGKAGRPIAECPLAGEESDNTAKRITAALNACKGLTTDTLTALGDGGVAELIAALREVKAARISVPLSFRVQTMLAKLPQEDSKP